jgi:TonB family protein
MRSPLLLAAFTVAALLAFPREEIRAHTPSRESGDGYRFLVVHADVPLYPVVARMARLSGTVRVDVSVRKGTVVGVSVASHSSGALEHAAIANVKTWRFEPDCNGTLSVTYVYELEREQEFPPPNPHVDMRLPTYVRITAVPAAPRTLY